MDPALLAGPPEIGAARRAIGGADEARVATAAAGATGHQQTLPGGRQVTEQATRVAIRDHGPDRDAQQRVGATPPVLVRPLAVLTSLGGVLSSLVEIEERGDRGICSQDHVPTTTPIAPVGATPRDEFLPAEAHTARPAVATLDEDIDLVDEHREAPRRDGEEGSGGLRGDTDELVGALALDAHVAGRPREPRVVHAQADIGSRLGAGSAVANEYAAGGDELAAEALHPEHLGIGVAPVPGAAHALLVRH